MQDVQNSPDAVSTGTVSRSKKPRWRWVVAGQVPPPVHGQNLSVAQTLQDLSNEGDVETLHLRFNFSRTLAEIRKPDLHKMAEVLRVWRRLLAIRCRGRIDLLVYPAGGPHRAPLWRDILLLPVCLLLSRKVVIRFYAAGLANVLHKLDPVTRGFVRLLYGRCSGMVMTNHGRADPEAADIREIVVVPHQLDDTYRLDWVEALRSQEQLSLLYVGHLCEDKGTPALLEAFARLRTSHPDATLTLAGEPSAPYTTQYLHAHLAQLGIDNAVKWAGLLQGDAKWKAFAAANVFVFPSQAPFESFGRVLVEAMMWELPVVATNWRGNAEVLGDCGWLTDPVESDTLHDALMRAIAARPTWPEKGRLARKRFLTHFASLPDCRRLYEALCQMAETGRK